MPPGMFGQKYGMPEKDSEQPKREAGLVMTILTTRTLHYVDDDGITKEVAMTLFTRPDDDGNVRAGLRFGPPINWERLHPRDDLMQQIICILNLWWVRLFISGMDLANNIRWRDGQGMESFNCGLPALRKRPDTWVAPEIPPAEKNPGNLRVLSELSVSFPDSHGVEYGRPLYMFMPEQIDATHWKCGFAFDAKDSAPVRYGVGDDWIQSFLDAAAMMRVVYDASLPQGWSNHEAISLFRLPYKMGRGYFLDAPE